MIDQPEPLIGRRSRATGARAYLYYEHQNAIRSADSDFDSDSDRILTVDGRQCSNSSSSDETTRDDKPDDRGGHRCSAAAAAH